MKDRLLYFKNRSYRRKYLYSIFVGIIVCFSLLFGCSGLGNNINVISSGEDIRIFNQNKNYYDVTIDVLGKNIYSNSIVHDTIINVLRCLRSNFDDKLSLAAYAAKHNNQIPCKLSFNDGMKDTTIIYKIVPLSKNRHRDIYINGVCAHLVSINEIKDYSIEMRQWLFRNKQYMDDKILYNAVGVLRQLSVSKYERYSTYEKIPVLNSFKGFKYSVRNRIKGNYFTLLACNSQSEIDRFVENIVSHNFKYTSLSLSHPLLCYNSGKDSGYKCILLLAINKDWSYKTYPVGLVAIDNMAPSSHVISIANSYHFKNKIVELPSNRPKIEGYASVTVLKQGGNGVSCNITFEIDFGGDAKRVMIFRKADTDDILENNKPLIKVIDLSHVSNPYIFTWDMHLVEGDNLVPVIVTDNHGNSEKYEINIPAHFVYNSSDVDIDNNVNVYNN